jgi:hypothetical protein
VNPLERLLDVESRLNDGTITVDQACGEVFTQPKPWSTPWWKARRSELIGPACNTCGSAEPPLVLQHTWQPVSWKEALAVVGPPNWEWWQECHPLPKWEKPAKPLAERPVCPQCGSIRFRHRKRTNDWVCQAGQGGAPAERHADYTFAEPKIELRPDPWAWRQVRDTALHEHRQRHDARWQSWLRSPEGAENRLRALRLCIMESQRYFSFQDTKTLCRSCAGREDYHHIVQTEREATQRRFLQMRTRELHELDLDLDLE